MSTQTAVRLVCDRCNAVSESFDGSTTAFHEAGIEELRRKGWSVRMSSKSPFVPADRCPPCARLSRKKAA